MLVGMYTSLTGVNAFGKKLEVTANNIANSNSGGFKKSRTEFVEAAAPGSGVEAKVQQINTPGPQVLQDSPNGQALVELSNVDLGEEAVSLMIAQRGFELNLAALRAQDEALGSLVDVLR